MNREIVAAAAMVFIAVSGCAEQAQGRIASNHVTLKNVEPFEKQVIADLPMGTPKNDVEVYLTREKIPHDFFGSDPIYGPDGNSFICTIQNIGIRVIFESDLTIAIHLDADNKVDGVKFRIAYDAI